MIYKKLNLNDKEIAMNESQNYIYFFKIKFLNLIKL